MSEESRTKGELTVATPTNQFRGIESLPLIPQELHNNPAVYSTVKPDNPQAAAQLYDMMIEGGENAREHINSTFRIKDILVHPCTKTNPETGEVTPLPRIVIWTEAGDRIQFASFGIWASLMMMQFCKFKPFGPNDQEFTLVSVPLDHGKNMFKLVRARKPVSKGKDDGKPK